MRTIRANGIDLAVDDSGPSGRVVVLVHGFPLTHEIWRDQIAALAPHYRIIAPDLRGFGRSGVTPGRVTIDQFADELAAALDALGIAEPVVLAGLSMGGYIAMRVFEVHRARLAGLVLCDTRAAADTPQAAAARLESAARVEREGPAMLAEAMLPKMLSAATFAGRPDLVDRLRRMILGGDARGLAAAARGLAARPDFTPLLPRIDLPVLAIVGREDAISTPAEMGALVRAIGGARLVEIDAAGHMAPLEKPAEVAAAIAEFLDAC
ncbi:MAG: alpha/beta hydrolase [Thermoguttaceae bacterium]